MKDTLLAAARALDDGKPGECCQFLRSVPLARCDRSQRLVALALWRRVLGNIYNQSPATEAGWPEVSAALENVGAAAMDSRHTWSAYQALPVLESQIGAVDAAAIAASVLWDCVLDADPAMFTAVLELFFRGCSEWCAVALQQILSEQQKYSPSYWHFFLVAKSIPAHSHSDFAVLAAQFLRETRRNDLAPLFDVYLKQMRQAPVPEIVAAARALASPAQRMLVTEYMAHTGYTLDELRTVVSAFAGLAVDSAASRGAVGLLQARLANAECRWHDVFKFTEIARTDPQYRHPADLLRALALARLKKVPDAIAVLDDVVAADDVAPFQRARATFIRVTAELVRTGSPLPEERRSELFSVAVGRPLAQSLWVGRKLRWIERLAIKSYLDNGWRFQLYAYDDPDNIPKGCEVLDATAIIPAKDVFREGQSSGLHAGSVGAFSDLFRYRLLSKRGGMWTDTDVINLKKYDPDGQRFISTEITDAGLITLNGAIMAAAAGDELVVRAYDRARALLASNEKMFFTRIGPYLLAEIALELGVGTIELMPPSFLSPISWMNTATLLQPYDTVMQRHDFRQAPNVHVYTEMWRTLGLGLDRPPSSDTFLGRLYANHFGEEDAMELAANP